MSRTFRDCPIVVKDAWDLKLKYCSIFLKESNY